MAITQSKIRSRIVSAMFLLIFLLSYCWPAKANAQTEPGQAGCLTTTIGSGLVIFGPCPSFSWAQAAERQPEPYEDATREAGQVTDDYSDHWTLSGEPRTQTARSLVIMARAIEGLVSLNFALHEANSTLPCQTDIEGAPGLTICPEGMYLNGEPYNNPEE